MEQFILQSENVVLDDLTINVRLFPTNAALVEMLDTHKNYNNLVDATADLSSFITTMTPILYNGLESSIKANYYL